MTPNQEGDLDPRPARPGPWRLLAVPALAVLLAVGVALALPASPPAEPAVAAAQACAGGAIALPPGHPPVDGFMPPGGAALLPPGHPPIERPRAQRAGPPLASPAFKAPEVLDI